ncbi:MAG TPA: hypothetical protein DCM70_02770 [Rhodobacteraceae bacterium]|nr:hypothetical protein [Paracoccaceae bacterium]
MMRPDISYCGNSLNRRSNYNYKNWIFQQIRPLKHWFANRAKSASHVFVRSCFKYEITLQKVSEKTSNNAGQSQDQSEIS